LAPSAAAPASETVVVGDVGDDDPSGPIVAADDDATDAPEGFVATSEMRTTTSVNLRKGGGKAFAVLAVIPGGTVVKVIETKPSNGFLNVRFNGTAGWTSAKYLATSGDTTSGSTDAVDVNGVPSPSNALARAKTAVGFSYYWGAAAWLASGVSDSTAGSCTGNCPSCSHSGRYGADCSGLIAKAWQFGLVALSANSHPYSTLDFVRKSSNWSTISRASLQKGDALVYNESGRGHIVMYEKGDAWGTPTVVECRGCAYGCVHNARSFASKYKAIRRAGF
jgi:cell wall-associated NlpC family hydrolase